MLIYLKNSPPGIMETTPRGCTSASYETSPENFISIRKYGNVKVMRAYMTMYFEQDAGSRVISNILEVTQRYG